MEGKIPESIKKQIESKEYSRDTIGRSGSQILCFSDMVLKAERDREESGNEHEILSWLQGRLPVPKIICAEKMGDTRF